MAKYILTDGYDRDRVWVHKSKDDLISHLLEMIGDMDLEVEK